MRGWHLVYEDSACVNTVCICIGLEMLFIICNEVWCGIEMNVNVHAFRSCSEMRKDSILTNLMVLAATGRTWERNHASFPSTTLEVTPAWCWVCSCHWEHCTCPLLLHVWTVLSTVKCWRIICYHIWDVFIAFLSHTSRITQPSTGATHWVIGVAHSISRLQSNKPSATCICQ